MSVIVAREFWCLGCGFGWLLVAGLMRAMVVALALVFGENAGRA